MSQAPKSSHQIAIDFFAEKINPSDAALLKAPDPDNYTVGDFLRAATEQRTTPLQTAIQSLNWLYGSATRHAQRNAYEVLSRKAATFMDECQAARKIADEQDGGPESLSPAYRAQKDASSRVWDRITVVAYTLVANLEAELGLNKPAQKSAQQLTRELLFLKLHEINPIFPDAEYAKVMHFLHDYLQSSEDNPLLKHAIRSLVGVADDVPKVERQIQYHNLSGSIHAFLEQHTADKLIAEGYGTPKADAKTRADRKMSAKVWEKVNSEAYAVLASLEKELNVNINPEMRPKMPHQKVETLWADKDGVIRKGTGKIYLN